MVRRPSAESEVHCGYDSSWEVRIFFCHTRVTRQKPSFLELIWFNRKFALFLTWWKSWITDESKIFNNQLFLGSPWLWMTTVRRSEIIDVLEWMATPSLLHLQMNETTHLLSMQIYRRFWIDTRSSINFFCCAKFVDRDDWSNNSAVFLVWNAIILRHLKERDAWIFCHAVITKDKLIMTVYVGGVVPVPSIFDPVTIHSPFLPLFSLRLFSLPS